MRLSHETPVNITHLSHVINDYEYALVHLFEDWKGYYNYMRCSVDIGRTVYLDNSLYELKKAFDTERYVYWIKQLEPTYFIIPDAYNYAENLELYHQFMDQHKKTVAKFGKIAVVHATNEMELQDCYKYFDAMLGEDDIIAFTYGDPGIGHNRVENIKNLYNAGIINTNRKHHVLGSLYPTEFAEYKDMPFIYSGDTSLPVIASWLGNKLETLKHKPKETINEIFGNNKEFDRDLLRENINFFRQMCGLEPSDESAVY
jgi:hypothetical protein